MPQITRCIYENVEFINTASAQQSLGIFLVWLTNQWPREVVRSLLKIAPSSDRYCHDNLKGFSDARAGDGRLSA